MSIGMDVACVVLAGGRGSRLYELTQSMCKPALPFGSGPRIIDWTLGNLVQSRLDHVTVATQFQPAHLHRHLSMCWRSAFASGLFVADGAKVTGTKKGYRGTADAVRQNMESLIGSGASTILIVAADHIYSMDYRAMIDAHRASGAGMTVAVTTVPSAEATGLGVVEAGKNGLIAGFFEKSEHPLESAEHAGQSLVSMGIYLCEIDWLVSALEEEGDDFGYDILPRAVSRAAAGYFLVKAPNGDPVYWQDVGTLDAYREVLLALTKRPWQCLPRGRPGMLASCSESTEWAKSGTVLMPGSSIAPGAIVRNAILAPGVHIGPTEMIGVNPMDDASWLRVTTGGTTLVTRDMMERRQQRVAMVPSMANDRQITLQQSL